MKKSEQDRTKFVPFLRLYTAESPSPLYVFGADSRPGIPPPHYVAGLGSAANGSIGLSAPSRLCRKEEHAQFGKVLAVHFHSRSETPLYVGNHHYEALRSLLALSNGQAQQAS